MVLSCQGDWFWICWTGTACTVCERPVNTKIGDKHLWLVFTSYSINYKSDNSGCYIKAYSKAIFFQTYLPLWSCCHTHIECLLSPWLRNVADKQKTVWLQFCSCYPVCQPKLLLPLTDYRECIHICKAAPWDKDCSLWQDWCHTATAILFLFLTSSLKKHTFYNLLINNILYLCVT